MKNLTTRGFAFCLLSILVTISFPLTSCQKENSRKVAEPDQAVQKIMAWVNGQKSGKTEVGIKKIQLLINALNLSKITTEQLPENERMFIIPLDKSFKTKYNKGEISINVLCIIENKIGEIKRGHIVQFVPAQGKNMNEISQNTFHNIYNNEKLSDDGCFSFLSLLGNFRIPLANPFIFYSLVQHNFVVAVLVLHLSYGR